MFLGLVDFREKSGQLVLKTVVNSLTFSYYIYALSILEGGSIYT